MEKEKHAYMLPVHESFHTHQHKNCTFLVRSLFFGCDTIIPKLQELMVDRLIDEIDTEENIL